jgi:hypothetical protein
LWAARLSEDHGFLARPPMPIDDSELPVGFERRRDSGYRARRLEDGYPEWKTAGLPIDSAH